MYKLKSIPEDFIVKEIANHNLTSQGKYAVCLLKKKEYNTMKAVQRIADTLKIPVKDIGFAGTKDKKAITEQYISIKGIKKDIIQQIKLGDIELTFKGYSDKPISLGDLEGNIFTITIRGITKIKNKKIMPNFFGEQRFSKSNVEIGRLIIKNDYKKALELIKKTDQKTSINHPNDVIGSLRSIPFKLLRLYVYAFQSHIWNEALKKYMKVSDKNIEIPIIGFDTEIKDKAVKNILSRLMAKERITFRDFINRQIPELSMEGNSRRAYVEIKDLRVINKGNDFITIHFALPKGSYATEAIKVLAD